MSVPVFVGGGTFVCSYPPSRPKQAVEQIKIGHSLLDQLICIKHATKGKLIATSSAADDDGIEALLLN